MQITDIHFHLNTLDVASAALKMALVRAHDLDVPLVISGDLNDTKGILRAEVVNRLIRIFQEAKAFGVRVLCVPGNHDRLNEKKPSHALEFLKPYIEIVEDLTPFKFDELPRVYLSPYISEEENAEELFNKMVNPDILIMHQGVKGAWMGEYAIDKSSVAPEYFDKFNCPVYSGHYHRRQKVGPVQFIGNSYTRTFGEAHDGLKGFEIIYSDRSSELVPTNLRKHVIHETGIADVMKPIPGLNKCDLLWLKVTGPYLELEKLDKWAIGNAHLGHQNFNLDKILVEEQAAVYDLEHMTTEEILDQVVDDSEESEEKKAFLKALWREGMRDYANP